jgi:hypothetical protein
MSNKQAEKPNSPQPQAYRRPSLVKGPVLTTVTAQSVSGNIAQCWVARAAFGESDMRWMIFREWLTVDAPAWFRNLYLRHGEAVGAWLKDHPTPRAVVRHLMMPAVTRIVRR